MIAHVTQQPTAWRSMLQNWPQILHMTSGADPENIEPGGATV